MARTGLRMMPTFPSPPLKFRTAGFPQYGFKAGLSEGAFPARRPIVAPSWFASLLRAPRFQTRLSPLGVGAVVRLSAAIRATVVALPQGSSLRSGFFCPGPSTLNRPHPPQLRAHLNFAALAVYMRCPRCACSSMPRRPTTGSELSLMLFRNMSSSETTGNSSAALTQFFTEDTGLQHGIKVSAYSLYLTLRFWWGVRFRGLTTVRFRYDLLLCLPSCRCQIDFAGVSDQPKRTCAIRPTGKGVEHFELANGVRSLCQRCPA